VEMVIMTVYDEYYEESVLNIDPGVRMGLKIFSDMV
jgi:hypothetical protein